VRIRLAVRCKTAQIALIIRDRKGKQQFWALLDEITGAVGHHPSVALAQVRRKLRALTPS